MPEELTFLQLKGNYRDLIAYQKTECVYDTTYYFAHRYSSKGDRTVDRMVQAITLIHQTDAFL